MIQNTSLSKVEGVELHSMASPNRVDAATSDVKLLAAIASTNETALGLLYDRYGKLVYRIAFRIIGEATRAEEVVQDVFHAVWRDACSFDMHRAVRPWLSSITCYRAIDATRGRNRWHNTLTVYLEDEVADAHTATDAILDQLQVRAALQVLSHEQRIVIELAYYEGFSCSEIAAYMAIPLGTVKTRLRLGLMKLRTFLNSGTLNF